MPSSYDETLRRDWMPLVVATINPDSPEAVRMKSLADERRAREAAMTPEERELRDLKREIADMRARLDHALRALNGESCGWDS